MLMVDSFNFKFLSIDLIFIFVHPLIINYGTIIYFVKNLKRILHKCQAQFGLYEAYFLKEKSFLR